MWEAILGIVSFLIVFLFSWNFKNGNKAEKKRRAKEAKQLDKAYAQIAKVKEQKH